MRRYWKFDRRSRRRPACSMREPIGMHKVLPQRVIFCPQTCQVLTRRIERNAWASAAGRRSGRSSCDQFGVSREAIPRACAVKRRQRLARTGKERQTSCSAPGVAERDLYDRGYALVLGHSDARAGSLRKASPSGNQEAPSPPYVRVIDRPPSTSMAVPD